jgi:hypothetical protein
MLLQITALLLPWWMATNRTYGFSVTYGLWSDAGQGEDVHGGYLRLTAVLAILALPLLFVRVAGRSIFHEPRRFRRDVLAAGILMLLALASAWLWPVELPFWGGYAYPGGNGTEAQHLFGSPAAGWWTSAVAVALVAWALLLARGPATEK